MATRQQLTDRVNQTVVCFVLDEYSDDPDISAYMVGQNVPLPPEATEHIPFTPTASAAVYTKNGVNFNDRVMNDNDEPWATEADHRTSWNETFKSGTHRGVLYGIDDYVCNPLLNDVVIDFDDEPGVDRTARDSDQSNSPGCLTHAMVNVRGCEIPRKVLQAIQLS